jgi:ATP-dependent Clp protease adaptor protein ClpS
MTTDTVIKSKVNTQIKEPPLFKVIYMNDEVTTAEFVIESLISVFHLDREIAIRITQDIHVNGSAIVAILPYEIAEQKGIEVSLMAKRNGFPLVVKLEADE